MKSIFGGIRFNFSIGLAGRRHESSTTIERAQRPSKPVPKATQSSLLWSLDRTEFCSLIFLKIRNYYSELYNRVSKIPLQNGNWTLNEWYPILRDE
ncbi:hypothetical protein BWD14_06095 [Leptospira santarosai]|uniref:Uncharacterized protein n=1 Tax=Leptospira santarosai TaxID=28183 RepID=A0AB73M565_9LEPT|nr:hypothetical protein BWD14_06095 [Leptospira santarosai]